MLCLALVGVLPAAPLWAQAQQQPAAATTPVSKAVHGNAAAVAKQREAVQRLQSDVAAQEADSQAAAEKLKQQDAEIAELRRQLQAAQQAGAAAAPQH
jgi:hypothetical protein